MSRVYLGVLVAGALSLLGAQPAAAGCCNSWGSAWGPSWGASWSSGWDSSWGVSSGWGWGSRGCCWSGAVALRPVVVQPAPVVVLVQEPVAALAVNQGPVFSGPGTDYWPGYYQRPGSVAAYPYVGGGYVDAPAYRRSHRHHHLGARTSYRWSGYRSGPRHPHRHHHRHHGDAPKYYK